MNRPPLKITNHTVGTLARSVSNDDLVEALGRMYYEDQLKCKNGYLDVLAKIQMMTAAETAMQCVITMSESCDELPEKVPHVNGIEKGDDDTSWAIEYMPWNEWIDMPILIGEDVELSDADQLAYILYEMTWAGFSQGEVQAQKDEIMERIEEVKKMIAGMIEGEESE